MVIEIGLFGPLRQFSKHGSLSVDVSFPCLVRDLRQTLKNNFRAALNAERAEHILNKSACSDGERILRDDEYLPDDRQISFLPPICGG